MKWEEDDDKEEKKIKDENYEWLEGEYNEDRKVQMMWRNKMTIINTKCQEPKAF